MSYLSPSLSLLINAVKKAAASLNRDFSEIEQLQSSVKGYKEFVVASYTRVSKALQVELGKIHPDYAIVTEAEKLGSRPCFIVAPIDGLSNYAHGIPHFAVSVAVYEGGAITAAVVYNPAADNLYFAEKGKGAYKEGFRNHERLRVSARKDVKEALVSTLVNYQESISEYDALQKKLVAATDNLRISGSCALDMAYVASGKYDAAVSRGNKPAVISMILTRKTNAPKIWSWLSIPAICLPSTTNWDGNSANYYLTNYKGEGILCSLNI